MNTDWKSAMPERLSGPPQLSPEVRFAQQRQTSSLNSLKHTVSLPSNADKEVVASSAQVATPVLANLQSNVTTNVPVQYKANTAPPNPETAVKTTNIFLQILKMLSKLFKKSSNEAPQSSNEAPKRGENPFDRIMRDDKSHEFLKKKTISAGDLADIKAFVEGKYGNIVQGATGLERMHHLNRDLFEKVFSKLGEGVQRNLAGRFGINLLLMTQSLKSPTIKSVQPNISQLILCFKKRELFPPEETELHIDCFNQLIHQAPDINIKKNVLDELSNETRSFLEQKLNEKNQKNESFVANLEHMITSETKFTTEDKQEFERYFTQPPSLSNEGLEKLANLIAQSEKLPSNAVELIKSLDTEKINKNCPDFPSIFLDKLFEKSSNNNRSIDFMKSLVSLRLEAETDPYTLLRGNDTTTKLITAYEEKVFEKSGFTNHLKTLINKANNTSEFMEGLIKLTNSKEFPSEIADFTRNWKDSVSKQFDSPEIGEKMVSQLFFLRFLNAKVQSSAKTEIAKNLQWLANRKIPQGKGEEFKSFEAKLEKIERNIQGKKFYLDKLGGTSADDIVNDKFIFDCFQDYAEDHLFSETVVAYRDIQEFKEMGIQAKIDNVPSQILEKSEQFFKNFYEVNKLGDSSPLITLSDSLKDELQKTKTLVDKSDELKRRMIENGGKPPIGRTEAEVEQFYAVTEKKISEALDKVDKEMHLLLETSASDTENWLFTKEKNVGESIQKFREDLNQIKEAPLELTRQTKKYFDDFQKKFFPSEEEVSINISGSVKTKFDNVRDQLAKGIYPSDTENVLDSMAKELIKLFKDKASEFSNSIRNPEPF